MSKAILALTLLISLFGCSQASVPDKRRALTVRLAYPTQFAGSLLHLAMAKGFFREEGVELLPQVTSTGKQAMESVLSGAADLATASETPVVFAAVQGEPISVVASLFSSDTNNAILANRAAGISSPGDLRGKRIGFSPGTSSDHFLSSFLLANKIAAADVTLVPLQPNQMQGAVLAGRVDAVAIWNQYRSSMARALGTQAVTFSDSNLYTENFLLAGRPAFVQGNRELMRRILHALLRAEEFAARHPGEAQSLVAANLKIDQDLLRLFWQEGTLAVSLDHSLLISLEEVTRWALKNRLESGMRVPNYLEVIDSGPLAGLKPEAVDMHEGALL